METTNNFPHRNLPWEDQQAQQNEQQGIKSNRPSNKFCFFALLFLLFVGVGIVVPIVLREEGLLCLKHENVIEKIIRPMVIVTRAQLIILIPLALFLLILLILILIILLKHKVKKVEFLSISKHTPPQILPKLLLCQSTSLEFI